MIDVRSQSAVLDRWCADAGRAAAARGVVGIVDYEAPWQLDAWAARIAGGADALRVVASVWPEALDGSDGPIARGLRSGDVVPGIARVADDGAAEGRHRRLAQHPYGLLRRPLPRVDRRRRPAACCCVAPDELLPLLRRAARHGIDAAVHAIGDRANALVLDAFAALTATGCPVDQPAHRARSAPARRRPGPVRRARGGGERAAGARARRPRRRRPALGGPHRPRLPLPHPARRRRRDRSRLRRARRAARPVGHDRGRGAPQRRRPRRRGTPSRRSRCRSRSLHPPGPTARCGWAAAPTCA